MILGAPLITDPFFSSVKLLCHFDGTNGQTTFTDNETTPKTLTATNATVDTSIVKFGTGSGDFRANANSHIDVGAPATDFGFLTNQFTVEFQGYVTSFSGASIYIGMGNFKNALLLSWDFGLVLGNLAFYYSTTGVNNLNVGAAYTPALNTWVAYAVDRDASNVLRVYADGAVIASATVTASIPSSAQAWWIGNDQNSGRRWPGYMDEIRVTNGVARYGGAYTPATAAFPDS